MNWFEAQIRQVLGATTRAVLTQTSQSLLVGPKQLKQLGLQFWQFPVDAFLN
jgi:hypothetical protein